MVFTFIWSTLVYDIITYWTWAPNGWLHNYGTLDFAGGTPVHITSGFSALAYALAVGPRRTVDFKKLKPSNPSDIYLGTALLWFGWFGFNGKPIYKSLYISYKVKTIPKEKKNDLKSFFFSYKISFFRNYVGANT